MQSKLILEMSACVEYIKALLFVMLFKMMLFKIRCYQQVMGIWDRK